MERGPCSRNLGIILLSMIILITVLPTESKVLASKNAFQEDPDDEFPGWGPSGDDDEDDSDDERGVGCCLCNLGIIPILLLLVVGGAGFKLWHSWYTRTR